MQASGDGATHRLPRAPLAWGCLEGETYFFTRLRTA